LTEGREEPLLDGGLGKGKKGGTPVSRKNKENRRGKRIATLERKRRRCWSKSPISFRHLRKGEKGFPERRVGGKPARGGKRVFE